MKKLKFMHEREDFKGMMRSCDIVIPNKVHPTFAKFYVSNKTVLLYQIVNNKIKIYKRKLRGDTRYVLKFKFQGENYHIV